MKSIITSILIISTFISSAQEVERSVISSSGGSYANGSGQLSFTIGEVVTATLSTGTNDLTQGFQQSTIFVASIENLKTDFKLNVFPNPTTGIVYIKSKVEMQSIELLDVFGKLIKSYSANDNKIEINTAPGVYFLRINTEGQENIIRVVKQ